MDIYIDDIVVNSADFKQHLADLEQSFMRIQKHSLKVNPAKCAIGVSAINFLGFLVHNQGIEVDKSKSKTKVVFKARPSRNKKELLLGKTPFSP